MKEPTETTDISTEENIDDNNEPIETEDLILIEDSFGRGINKKVLLVTKGVTLKKLHLMSK